MKARLATPLALLLLTGALALCAVPAAAQGLEGMLKRIGKQVKEEVQRKVEDKAKKTVTEPVGRVLNGGTAASTTRSGVAGIAYDAPRRDARVGQPPQQVWYAPAVGRKFEPIQENQPQIVAVNPYLTPEQPFFGAMHGMQCAADGSLVVAGEGGLDAEGGVKGVGWWKIATDGAITSLVSRPYGSPDPGVHPGADFSLASNGSLLMILTEEIKTNRVGTKVVRISPDGRMRTVAEGLEHPGMPVQDPSGNIWVSNKKSDELLRISPDGAIATVIGPERGWSNEALQPQERIHLEHIAWDPVHGELVAGGGRINAKPLDMHIGLWRIRPDGQARRVYYTVKHGRSPVGQNTDTIWALTVDAQGRIVVATAILNDRARRQIARLDEKTGKLVVLTGQSFAKAGFSHYRAGHEEAPHDGPAAHANFREANNICQGPDGALFVLDAHLVRRVNPDGNVRTWAY